MSYDTWEAARLVSWSNKQAGIGPLKEAELIRWIDAGVGGLEWEDVWEEDGKIEKYIDFPTLISLRLICLLHFDSPDFPQAYSNRVALEDITATMPKLRRELGLKSPFASKSLWNMHDKDTAVSVGESKGTETEWQRIYRKLCGGRRHWRIEAGLEYGEDGIACAWFPAEDIKIDPRFVSGSPCLARTRIPTGIIFGMVKAGDTVEELAEDYDVPKGRINNAVKWENQLADAAA